MDPISKHEKVLKGIGPHFDERLQAHGANYEGLGYNSDRAQEVRFDQLLKIVDKSKTFSLIDYGCGFGSLAAYMQKLGYRFSYTGFDISEGMIEQANKLNPPGSGWIFTTKIADLKPVDYTIGCGIFNLRFNAPDEDWMAYILETLENMDELSGKGFSFNMLTMYSDADKMRADHYYSNPGFFFDYCKRHFSRNVALLHDYEIYDFTILVRKSL